MSGDWRNLALCAEVDPELFFPEKGGSHAAPKSVCARCDVRTDCRDFAVARPELTGIWGGTSEKDRITIRTKQVAA